MSLDSIGYLKNFPSFVQEGTPPCAEIDPDLFFPVEPFEGAMQVKEYYYAEAEAKKVCSECPYKIACFSYAMENADLQGIWGGTTSKDRAAIRRGRGIKMQKSLGLTPTKRR
jgi:WhiB family redox-sensing transcriptional regulator